MENNLLVPFALAALFLGVNQYKKKNYILAAPLFFIFVGLIGHTLMGG